MEKSSLFGKYRCILGSDVLKCKTVNIPVLSEEDFLVKAPINEGKVTLTTIDFNDIGTTEKGEVSAEVKKGVVYSLPKDCAFVTVINRHGREDKPFIGVVRNTGLKDGAYATTVAHDSHNLVVVGKNKSDMMAAVKKIRNSGGGLCLVQAGKVISSVDLPIAGLMTPRPIDQLAKEVEIFNEKAKALGVQVGKRSPAMAFSSIALTVIPEIRISDLGLIDVNQQVFLPLFKD